MLLDCPYLSLAPTWVADGDPRNVALVLAVDALRLRHAGRCETADATDALFDFESLCRSRTGAVRDFVLQARLASAYSTWLDDPALIRIVADGLRTGTLSCVHPKIGATDSDPVQLQRRLVRAIESQNRGLLRVGSKQFRLVVGTDLRTLPDRESYEVVARGEAQQVLSEIARQSGRELGDLLGKAKGALAPDWRPPLKPNGVVLLRRIYTPSVMVASQEPALTPSQLWGKVKADDEIVDWTIWIELDPSDPKASDDVVILLDEFHQEVMRKPLTSCPREGAGVLVTFEQLNKNDRFTLIRDYGPNEGGGQDSLFINSSPAEMDERGSQAS
jgi:hypothetical protein